MSAAGYVLAGGNSTRMGTDKALLQLDGVALVVRSAQLVAAATGSATIVGDPAKYARFGFPVIPDRRPGHGPLAGIETALLNSEAEWNLIVACDMVALEGNFFASLCRLIPELDAATDCLIPIGPDQRLQPLTGIYRRRCLQAVSAALDAGNRKVTDMVTSLNHQVWQAPDAQLFQNVNTPEDWNRYTNGRPN